MSVDLLHALHLVVGQEGSFAHKFLVYLFEQLLILALQGIVFVVIDLTDAFEERLIEGYLVLEIGDHGLHLLLDVTYLWRLVGLDNSEEDAAHTVEQTAAVLEGQDGVLEGGRFLAVDNLLDVVALLLDSCFEGRQVVGNLYLAEVGGAERQRALLEQGILVLCLLAGSERHHHG